MLWGCGMGLWYRAVLNGGMWPGHATANSTALLQLQRAVTLESFSVLLAQLLGRSMGMGFDDGRGCHCPTYSCVMESAAM